jgi:hypothetical protein
MAKAMPAIAPMAIAVEPAEQRGSSRAGRAQRVGSEARDDAPADDGDEAR